MREQSFQADENNTFGIQNQVPSSASHKRSKRKMDAEKRSKITGRGIVKNQPQPHMCIRDSILETNEPCYINVLSWEKILMPSKPNDPVPLYGGIRIVNNSMNSLLANNLCTGNPCQQPIMFAVLANTEILKQSGKGSTDNDRDALIDLILDFIEAMNKGVHFQHKFVVLPDRDVVGELKDIWYIIKNKREQDKLEMTNHGAGDKGLMSNKQISIKSVSRSDSSGASDWGNCDQGKKKISRSHSHPGSSHGNENGLRLVLPQHHENNAGDNFMLSYYEKSNHGSSNQSRLLIPQHLENNSRDNFMLSYDKNNHACGNLPRSNGEALSGFDGDKSSEEEEIAWERHRDQKMFNISHSLPNYTFPSLSPEADIDSNSAMAISYADQYSLDDPVCDYPELLNQNQKVECKEGTLFASLLHREIDKCYELPTEIHRPGKNRLGFESFENENEEDMFDKVRHVVATEILPSLDSWECNTGDTSTVNLTSPDQKCPTEISFLDERCTMLIDSNESLSPLHVIDKKLSHIAEAINSDKLEIQSNKKNSLKYAENVHLSSSAKLDSHENAKSGEIMKEKFRSDNKTTGITNEGELQDKYDSGISYLTEHPAVDISVQNCLFDEINMKISESNKINLHTSTRMHSSLDYLENKVVFCSELSKTNDKIEVLQLEDSVKSTTAIEMPLGLLEKNAKDTNENMDVRENINTMEAINPFSRKDTMSSTDTKLHVKRETEMPSYQEHNINNLSVIKDSTLVIKTPENNCDTKMNV